MTGDDRHVWRGHLIWEVTTGDCLDVMPRMAADKFDAVITDPPYNVGKNYGDGHDDRLSAEEYEAWLREVLTECGRVSRGPVVFFPGTTNALRAGEVLKGTGLRPFRLLGWHKREFAGDKWNGGPAMCWEPIVWATAEDKPFFNRLYGTVGRDFLTVNEVKNDPYRGPGLHPNPKPLPVMRWLVGLFVRPGGSVLDPFAGTGTTLRAAVDAGCSASGIELNRDYIALLQRRMAQGVLEAA